jgi:hypothetical protein
MVGSESLVPSLVMDTSSTTRLSGSWFGTANNTLRITSTTSFGVNNTYFTTAVMLENIGAATLTNVDYMRNVDPDQEQVWLQSGL